MEIFFQGDHLFPGGITENCSLQNASLFLVRCQFKNKELLLVQAGPSCPDSSRIIAEILYSGGRVEQNNQEIGARDLPGKSFTVFHSFSSKFLFLSFGIISPTHTLYASLEMIQENENIICPLICFIWSCYLRTRSLTTQEFLLNFSASC